MCGITNGDFLNCDIRVMNQNNLYVSISLTYCKMYVYRSTLKSIKIKNK